jgi:hypothetical protein
MQTHVPLFAWIQRWGKDTSTLCPSARLRHHTGIAGKKESRFRFEGGTEQIISAKRFLSVPRTLMVAVDDDFRFD